MKTAFSLGFGFALSLLAVSGTAQDPFAFPSLEAEATLPGAGPLRRYEGLMKRWPEMRAKWASQVEADQGAVVFFGDSITQGWGRTLPDRFPGMKSANRGIGGDTTRGMRIRLQEDVLSLNPAALVMLMGTNDIEVGLEPAIAAENMGQILGEIRAHDPEIPVVLCLVFPSSPEKQRPRERIEELNRLYAGLARGNRQVTVLDTWTLFAGPDGEADPKWFGDLLHLNAAGYDRWAAALRPILATLGFLETERVGSPMEEGFVSLFNGKDLTGWGYLPTPPRKQTARPLPPDAPVEIEVKEAVTFDGRTESDDGRFAAIHGRLVVKAHPGGRRIQHLWTTEALDGDFVLKLEFRATPNADSGVLFHPAPGSEDGPVFRRSQLQCRDYPLAGPYKDLQRYRAQDWNELVVTVRGGKARATCNGEVLEEAMPLPPKRFIGLEGDRGQMEYRYLRVKKLN